MRGSSSFSRGAAAAAAVSEAPTAVVGAASEGSSSSSMAPHATTPLGQRWQRRPHSLRLLVLAAAGLLLLAAQQHAARAYQFPPSPFQQQQRQHRQLLLSRKSLTAKAAAATTRPMHGNTRCCACHGHGHDGGCHGHDGHNHHQQQLEQQQQRAAGGPSSFLRRLPGARALGKWRRARQQQPVDEEENDSKSVSLSKLAGGLVLAAIGPNPWDRGMGINPTPPSALAIWGPYVFTLLFLTFGMRGLEPLKRYLYDRQKRRKQAKKNAAKPKKKAYYRQPSRLYAMAQKKLAEQQAAGGNADEAGAVLPAEGEGAAGGAEEEEEEEEVVEAPLSAYRCEVCSFTIYPARGREFKFFPAGFKCPSCGAPKEKFYDLTDPDDPRNQEGGGEASTEGAEDDLGDDDAFQLDDEEAPQQPGTTNGGYPAEPSGALQ